MLLYDRLRKWNFLNLIKLSQIRFVDSTNLVDLVASVNMADSVDSVNPLKLKKKKDRTINLIFIRTYSYITYFSE